MADSTDNQPPKSERLSRHPVAWTHGRRTAVSPNGEADATARIDRVAFCYSECFLFGVWRLEGPSLNKMQPRARILFSSADAAFAHTPYDSHGTHDQIPLE